MYFCLCDNWFIGRYCDIDINECKIYLFCRNGVMCVNMFGFYDCICLIEWEGDLCEIDINECISNFCLLNIMCINRNNGFDC